MGNEIGLIIATHGNFASSLVQTAEMILGRETSLQAFEFPDHEPAQESAKKLEALIQKSNRGSGVIILSDLFGGTPGSLALSMLEEEAVEVISGVNLPMAIAAAMLEPGLDLSTASQSLLSTGREGIKKAGSILKAKHPRQQDESP